MIPLLLAICAMASPVWSTGVEVDAMTDESYFTANVVVPTDVPSVDMRVLLGCSTDRPVPLVILAPQGAIVSPEYRGGTRVASVRVRVDDGQPGAYQTVVGSDLRTAGSDTLWPTVREAQRRLLVEVPVYQQGDRRVVADVPIITEAVKTHLAQCVKGDK